jgi:peptidoglycan-N-acetylglucosamine deacetylase
MRSSFAAHCLLAFFTVMGPAARADCPDNPGALGTSRTIAVDPAEHPFLGAFHYRESLPLNDREVVLTFDDGPLPPYTNRVLDILAAECVKATFFLVGRMARAYPQLVKRTHHDGHTLANHSQNHPFTFHKMPIEQARQEIEDGFASIRAALGDAEGVTSFFRIPGLLRQDAVEEYLSARGYMTWSVDVLADDWRRISADEVVHRALSRLESRGKGILLLHDIQPATVLALPILLRELKERGYKIVHVVEASAERPKTATRPEQWAVMRSERPSLASLWPRAEIAGRALPEPVLAAPGMGNFGIADPADPAAPGAVALSPRSLQFTAAPSADLLPAPDASNFRYWRMDKPRRAARILPRPAAPAAKDTTGSITRSTAPASRPARPSGHQLQLPKPTAGLLDRLSR